MSDPPPPPRPGGLSLYANLIDDNSSSTVSGAPVLYNSQAGGVTTAKKSNPSLLFQPIRRPQAKTNKAQPKPGIFPKSAVAAQQQQQLPKPAAVPTPELTAADNAPTTGAKTTLADWANTEDDEYLYSRGSHGKKRRKRRGKNGGDNTAQTDWNELYDPTRPTNVEEYMASNEKIWEIREWRDILYRHRRRERDSDRSDGEDEDRESRPMPTQFAPPTSYTAVPPLRSPQPSAAAPDDATGDDAYARRLAMSQATAPPPPPPEHVSPPPPADNGAGYSATISRAPVRYVQPHSPSPPSTPRAGLGSVSADDDPPQRSTIPGQAGFAERLMGKYGWSKGSGLGADGSGIINPLQVKVEKRKRRPDSEGGGWAEPTAKAKIFGGKKKPTKGGPESYGPMSEVVVLRDMLDGMEDLEGEIAGGLSQEIGEECGEKYGRVERIKIDPGSKQVFIKFTDVVSALRAVSELDGRVFNGNAIVARFHDLEKFEKGVLR